jgi:hypothetical protein
VQVPASVSTAGAENAAAGTSSSLFGALTGAPSAKKGQLPPFAAILSEQSFGEDTGKDIGDLSSEDGGVNEPLGAALSLTAQAGPKALFNALPVEAANSDGAQNKMQSGTSETSKNEIKPGRHRTTSDSLSTASEKKQSPPAPELPPSAVSAFVPVTMAQLIPAVPPAKWSHALLDASSPSANAPSPQHSSIPQSQSEHSAVRTSSEVAKPATTSLAAESIAHDLQSQAVSSAKTQFTLSPVAADTAKTTASIPESVVRSRQVSSGVDILPVSGPSEGLNNAAVPFVGSVAQAATRQATAAPLSKSKTQEKANGDIGRGLSAPVAATGASSIDTAPSHGIASAMGPFVRSADAVDSSPKQELSTPDANAFQRLDSGAAPATLLHSSAHQIAVGVHDPSLGWLEVQTQSSAGHISATLTAASTEAHASLAAQAPEITQYLADRDVSVHSVNVHTQADTQNGASSGGGQPQSGTEDARHAVSEHGGVGLEESRSSSLSQTASEHMPQTGSSSYISIHA